MKKIYIIAMIALMFTACSTREVEIDYDTSYDFTKNKTYAIVHNVKEGDNTLVIDRIEKSIRANINAKGYKEVSKENAELIFVFHVQVVQMSDIRTDYERIGYGGYGYGGGYRGFGGFGGYGGGTMVVPRSTTYRWKEGKLVIDAYNPQTKKIIWRGVIKDEISNSSHSVEEKTAYIEKVVSQTLAKFPKSGV
ncbi:MAG: DUF4136 domain-containing protein [Sulfurimonas sp.]|nr:DUF4136 domain-containing protein [Sulfurimonas sp.]